jgi:hypothetical protein
MVSTWVRTKKFVIANLTEPSVSILSASKPLEANLSELRESTRGV